MHNEVSVSVDISRSPARVFASLIDLAKWPEWGGGNLVSMELLSDAPLQVGSQIRQTNRRGGKQTEMLVRVAQFVPDQTLAIERPKLRGTFTLQSIETGTRLYATFRVEAGGIMALMYRLFLKQFVQSDLHKFKAMVEAS
jgi:uncharacterized protein YndB with AHSA1/START domain